MKRAQSVALAMLALGMLAVVRPVYPQAPPPPAAPTPTIWSFFGIPQGLNKLHGTMFNRRGNHPGLEKKPPLKSLADAANLQSLDPAIKKAAQVKQAEDLAPQKIKAIKYLAEIGCGCYNIDGSITEALVNAMGDCTEDVRLATVKAVAEAAESGKCANCNQRSCCNEDISKKLAEIAYERDEHGCWLEPSERVREAAREALCVCCSGDAPVIIEEDHPRKETVPGKEGIKDEAPTPPMASQTVTGRTQLASSRRKYRTAAHPAVLTPAQRRVSSDARRGMTVYVDDASGTAQIELPDATERIPVGEKLRVFARSSSGMRPLGELQVIESSPGTAQVKPLGAMRISQIGPGIILAR